MTFLVETGSEMKRLHLWVGFCTLSVCRSKTAQRCSDCICEPVSVLLLFVVQNRLKNSATASVSWCVCPLSVCCAKPDQKFSGCICEPVFSDHQFNTPHQFIKPEHESASILSIQQTKVALRDWICKTAQEINATQWYIHSICRLMLEPSMQQTKPAQKVSSWTCKPVLLHHVLAASKIASK